MHTVNSSSGTYYAVAKRQGKIIRSSLKTDNLTVARRKLKDFLADFDRTNAGDGKTPLANWVEEYQWFDGRLAMIRGNRTGSAAFEGAIHARRVSRPFLIEADGTSFYACFLGKILRFVDSQRCPVNPAESLEVIAFLEAANASKWCGKWVSLKMV